MAPITAATAGKVCRSGLRDLGPNCGGVSIQCTTGFYAGPQSSSASRVTDAFGVFHLDPILSPLITDLTYATLTQLRRDHIT